MVHPGMLPASPQTPSFAQTVGTKLQVPQPYQPQIIATYSIFEVFSGLLPSYFILCTPQKEKTNNLIRLLRCTNPPTPLPTPLPTTPHHPPGSASLVRLTSIEALECLDLKQLRGHISCPDPCARAPNGETRGWWSQIWIGGSNTSMEFDKWVAPGGNVGTNTRGFAPPV